MLRLYGDSLRLQIAIGALDRAVSAPKVARLLDLIHLKLVFFFFRSAVAARASHIYSPFYLI